MAKCMTDLPHTAGAGRRGREFTQQGRGVAGRVRVFSTPENHVEPGMWRIVAWRAQ